MTDFLGLVKTALEATVIGKHVYEGFPDSFVVYPCASVSERISFGMGDVQGEVHELTVQAWTKGDAQVLKDLLSTLTVTGYVMTIASINDGTVVEDGAGVRVFPVTALYRVTGTTSGAGTTIAYPPLRPMEKEVENALHNVGGLNVWRIDVTGMTIVSPTVVYEVIETWETSWYCNYTVTVDLIVDGEPPARTVASIIASMLRLAHARQLSYALSKDKETGYHIARMVFQIQRATGE